jgi:phage gpG-like protein
MSLETSLDSAQAQRRLTRVDQALGRTTDPAVLRPAFVDWLAYMDEGKERLFETGKRGNITWARLASSTKAGRRASGVGHSKPLNVTGGIKRSIKSTIKIEGGKIVGTQSSDHPLARIHHKGARIPARTNVRPKNAKALTFMVGSERVFVARVKKIPAAIIPARPILFITETDRATAMRFIRKYHLAAIEKAVRRA